MINKIGRNDPCPCGSGKKYKQCCLNANAISEPPPKAHDRAVERAIGWLMDKYRKGVVTAIESMLFDGLNDKEQDALEELDEHTWSGIQLNATEWLLAEGQILVKDKYLLVSELLLGRGGPLFTVGQRNWIVQLSERPLRLYDITDVIPGKQITICDALDTEAAPIVVQEISGSRNAQVGSKIGLRIMEVDGHHELSGAAYPFSQWAGQHLVEKIRAARDKAESDMEDDAGYMSFFIRRKWLEQYFTPVPIPLMMDAYSGEPILLITDHYHVNDWDALCAVLSTQSDVQGDRASGWNRLIECKDGMTRSLAAINIEQQPNKVSIFYKTQRAADAGRNWFDQLAKNSVRFVTREITDPKGAMATMRADQPAKVTRPKIEIPPDALSDILEESAHRTYKNWADEPIPALDGKTPRQAIKTEAGLERVKGLLRSYEASEHESAQEQGRREVSYDFLWDSLGITN